MPSAYSIYSVGTPAEPRTTDLFATMAKGKKFSKLYLSQAYKQMQLDEQSAQYLTINTHMGICVFFQPSVEYLGHTIDVVGIYPLPSKLEATV